MEEREEGKGQIAEKPSSKIEKRPLTILPSEKSRRFRNITERERVRRDTRKAKTISCYYRKIDKFQKEYDSGWRKDNKAIERGRDESVDSRSSDNKRVLRKTFRMAW